MIFQKQQVDVFKATKIGGHGNLRAPNFAHTKTEQPRGFSSTDHHDLQQISNETPKGEHDKNAKRIRSEVAASVKDGRKVERSADRFVSPEKYESLRNYKNYQYNLRERRAGLADIQGFDPSQKTNAQNTVTGREQFLRQKNPARGKGTIFTGLGKAEETQVTQESVTAMISKAIEVSLNKNGLPPGIDPRLIAQQQAQQQGQPPQQPQQAQPQPGQPPQSPQLQQALQQPQAPAQPAANSMSGELLAHIKQVLHQKINEWGNSRSDGGMNSQMQNQQDPSIPNGSFFSRQ